jgi:hypothetical protein
MPRFFTFAGGAYLAAAAAIAVLTLLLASANAARSEEQAASSKQQQVRLSSLTTRMALSISIGWDRSWLGWPMICAQR